MNTFTAQTEAELLILAAGRIADTIANCCRQYGRCSLGIVGGRTIPALLERLLPYAHSFKGKIDVFWLDERVGPEKNFAPALSHLEALHKHGVDIAWHPLQSLHEESMHIEARQVEQVLAQTGESRFDIVVCSAGEDGHVASLFPQHASLHVSHLGYVLEEHSPKPPAKRFTVTPMLLTTAKYAFLFVVGEKRHAYDLFLSQATIEECPAKLLMQVRDLSVLVSLR